MWFEQMHPGWQQALAGQRGLLDGLEQQLAGVPNLAPVASLVMAAFADDPAQVRVVILGQDPYPTLGVAVGRAFAVARDAAIPASLRNIFAELQADLGCGPDLLPQRNLASWQAQGVLLLNTALTTLEGQPGAHARFWQSFTDAALRHLAGRGTPLVAILWGAHAQKSRSSLEADACDSGTRLVVIESAHPSPLSARRGFFGSNPFSKANAGLQQLGLQPVEWRRIE